MTAETTADPMSTSTGYSTSYTVAQSPQDVFSAIVDVRGWWTGEIEGRTDQAGAEFTYRHPPQHYSRQRVVEFEPGVRVAWRVVESHLASISDPAEWTGSEIVFDISPVAGGTELRFTHVGLVPDVECFGACSTAWLHYVNGSLRSLITTGRGLPDPFIEEVGVEYGSIERQLHIDASPEVVYEVITSPEHIREWWPDDAELEPVPGAQGAVFWGDATSPRAKVATLTVVEAEPPTLFSFRWGYDEGVQPAADNSLLVTFELAASGEGTLLRFTETGFRERGWEAAVLEETYLDHTRGWDLFLPRLVTYAGGLAAGS